MKVSDLDPTYQHQKGQVIGVIGVYLHHVAEWSQLTNSN